MRVVLAAQLASLVAAVQVSPRSPAELRRPLGDMLRSGATYATVVEPSGEPLLRIGHGYDIHRMAPREEAGQPLVISGVTFDGSDAPDFELGCIAHSDGDVVYHSVVDAILGALSMPDIGQLFPDNDPRLRGANSEIFMVEAYVRMVWPPRRDLCDAAAGAARVKARRQGRRQSLRGKSLPPLQTALRTLRCPAATAWGTWM